MKEQVAQEYEVKDAATLSQFGIATDDQKDAVDKIVEDMKSTVQDATDAAKQAGEDEPEVAVEDDSKHLNYSMILKMKIKTCSAAWAMYKTVLT